VEAEINDLAMKSAFRIEMTSSERKELDWRGHRSGGVHDLDESRRAVAAAGTIASGGELSRVMLRLKPAWRRGGR